MSLIHDFDHFNFNQPTKSYLIKIHNQNHQLTATLNAQNIPLQTPHEKEIEKFPSLTPQILSTGSLKTYINNLPPIQAHKIEGVSQTANLLSAKASARQERHAKQEQLRWCSTSHWERREEMRRRTAMGTPPPSPPARCAEAAPYWQQRADIEEEDIQRTYREHIRPQPEPLRHGLSDQELCERALKYLGSFQQDDHQPEALDDGDKYQPEEDLQVINDQAPIRHGLYEQPTPYDEDRYDQAQFQQYHGYQAPNDQDQGQQEQYTQYQYDPTAFFQAQPQQSHHQQQVPNYRIQYQPEHSQSEQYPQEQYRQAPYYQQQYPQLQHQKAQYHQAHHHQAQYQQQSTHYELKFQQWQKSERKLSDEIEKHSRAKLRKQVQHLHDREEQQRQAAFQQWQESERKLSDEIEERSRAKLRKRVQHLHDREEREQDEEQQRQQEQEVQQEDEEWRRQLKCAAIQKHLAAPQPQPTDVISHGERTIYQSSYEELFPSTEK